MTLYDGPYLIDDSLLDCRHFTILISVIEQHFSPLRRGQTACMPMNLTQQTSRGGDARQPSSKPGFAARICATLRELKIALEISLLPLRLALIIKITAGSPI